MRTQHNEEEQVWDNDDDDIGGDGMLDDGFRDDIDFLFHTRILLPLRSTGLRDATVTLKDNLRRADELHSSSGQCFRFLL